MNRNTAFNKLHGKSTWGGASKGMERVHCVEFGLSRAMNCERVVWNEYTAMGADHDSRPSFFDDNEETGMYYFPFIVQQHYVAFNDE
jgi:hypothetical protein